MPDNRLDIKLVAVSLDGRSDASLKEPQQGISFGGQLLIIRCPMIVGGSFRVDG
jgi:hypothetical protein